MTSHAFTGAPKLVYTHAGRRPPPLPTCFLQPQQVLRLTARERGFLLNLATAVGISYLPWRLEGRHVAVVNECAGWLGVMTACLQYNDTGP